MADEIPTAERIGELVIDALYGRLDSGALYRALVTRLNVNPDVNPGAIVINYELDTFSGIELSIKVAE